MIDPAVAALAKRFTTIQEIGDGRLIVDQQAAREIAAALGLPLERKPLPESVPLADIQRDGNKRHGAAG
jgi:hypothetical protein